MQAGYPRTDDLNGYQQEGFGPMDRFVNRKGRRSSTSRGYLDMARERDTLTIETKTLVDIILFEGTRAVGVRYQIDGGSPQTAGRTPLCLAPAWVLSANAPGSMCRDRRRVIQC